MLKSVVELFVALMGMDGEHKDVWGVLARVEIKVSSSSLSIGVVVVWGRAIGKDGGGVGIGVVIGDFR